MTRNQKYNKQSPNTACSTAANLPMHNKHLHMTHIIIICYPKKNIRTHKNVKVKYPDILSGRRSTYPHII